VRASSIPRFASVLACIAVLSCGARTELTVVDPSDASVDTARTPRVDVAQPDDRPVDVPTDRPPLTGCRAEAIPRAGPVTNIAAPGRTEPVAVYDPATNRVIVLGGMVAGHARTTEMYAVDLETHRVQVLARTGESGPIPLFAQPVWDAPRHRAIVIGGVQIGRASAETLAIVIDGNQATVSRLEDYPAGPVQQVAAAIDAPRARIIATGGAGIEGRTSATFALVLATGRWQRILEPTQGPPAVTLRTMAYDPTTHRMVLTGGTVDDSLSYALPLEPLGAWQRLDVPLRLLPRTPRVLAWDDRVCGFLLVSSGGTATRCVHPTRFFRTDAPDDVTSLADIDVSALGRFSSATLYDPVRERLIFVGGDECTTAGVANDVLVESLDVVTLVH